MHSFMYLFRRHVGSFKVMLAVVFNMHLSLFLFFFSILITLHGQSALSTVFYFLGDRKSVV